MEIKDAIEKLKEPKEVLCGKCLKSPQPATNYCRDCGEFICTVCSTVHSQWGDFVNHEVVAIEQLEEKVKQLNALKKVTLYCSLHQGKELELYCETCEELICHNCTVKKHKDHQYDLVEDTFEKHKEEIAVSLEPIEKQLDVVSKALEQFDFRLYELDDLQMAIEDNIQQQIRHLQELLEARKAELINQLQQFIQRKKKNLVAQKDEVETVHTQLASCLTFVRESLRTESQGEVMEMKKAVMKQIKEMTNNFKSDSMLPPYEPINVEFKASPNVAQACQQFGEVCPAKVCPKECYATGKGLEIAKVGEKNTAVLHVIGQETETTTCELVSNITGKKIDCFVKKADASGQFEVSYQATNRGRHKLNIKVEGEHIKGSPFLITAKLPVEKLGTPIKTITGVEKPWGVTVNQRGEIIVAESSGNCISVFNQSGEKLRSFGSCGSKYGQFHAPHSVAVIDGGNILVGDENNHRIQKFRWNGKFVYSAGKKGNKSLEFNRPVGIAINSFNKQVYIADEYNRRIQIFLNSRLAFTSSIDIHSSNNGQPWDVACDSTGNVYVTDTHNHQVQVFTAEGEFMRKFGKRGNGNGELYFPAGISIDSDNVVYIAEWSNHRVSVFTSEGRFLTSFGTEGSGPGQFKNPCGITVDKNGVVYVSDHNNNRLQLF